MEFNRKLFYQLRDVAVLINGSSYHLKYSQSALELSFIYHKTEYRPTNPIIRWLVAASITIVSYQLWSPKSVILQAAVIVLLLGAVAFLFQGGSFHVGYGGKAVLTFNLASAVFLVASVSPKPISDIDGEFLLADIQFIRVHPIQLRTDDVEIGQIQIYRSVANTWHPLVELPFSAAEKFSSVLSLLTDAPVIPSNIPSTTWPARVGRWFGCLYRRLSNLIT